MRVLLDTHLVLWWMADDRSLSPQARAVIRDPENTVFVSAVSHWEMSLKSSLGKLEIPRNFNEKLDEAQFEPLPLTAEQARLVHSLPWHHRDPFDRMLVAQAKAEGLLLVTADDQLAPYGKFVRVLA